jgi:hypothetical protein
MAAGGSVGAGVAVGATGKMTDSLVEPPQPAMATSANTVPASNRQADE